MKVLMVASKSERGGAPRSMMDMLKAIKDNHGVEFVVLLHQVATGNSFRSFSR